MAAQSKAASSAQSKAAASSAVVSGGLFAGYVAIQLSTLLLASAAQQRDVQTRHVDSTAVTLSELVKLLISLVGIAATERVMLRGLLRAVRQSLLTPSLLRVALPALLYTVQNNVIYSSLARVDAVTFQITYQLKLAASVLASRLLLGKPVSVVLVLTLLPAVSAGPGFFSFLGVVLVQLSLRAEDEAAAALGGGAEDEQAELLDEDEQAELLDEVAKGERRRSRAIGICGVLAACGCSGLAGAAMEALLKEERSSLPRRNLQVSAVSLLLATAHMLSSDAQRLWRGGLLQGYSPLTYAMARYYSADPASRKPPPRQFLLGTALVLLALGTYSVA
ncbi:hypothetical protein EMIHUDRAFT_217278 [Emiliania huxleyi CCMP1516]|uniref:Sugar phosphate transporter domain-containing protein n=2 Tax=Emiliania huxleyi TaxID=2903 RepID=A0A0D3IBD6_EMIH1|nr:hypothetical protein EMIHUDRAFT_217278 [Emiliania huxleyi CCMP1516]EOD08571.1 hypothetical protein EMIHUDRAFT_217278 [Emiliania huxleyi CCMP1516]|eukprot:XP_005761000.1 hypothetical protein EMIHUDRAFT_217278 [Emiliania huxleyi CCMP1516]